MKPVRLGVVGLNFGRHVVNSLADVEGERLVEVVALCDQDEQRLRAVCAATRARGYTALDALLADGDVDAVGLLTGPVGRAELIRQCLHAGKHVMTTKPMENDPDAALEVLNEARLLGLVVHLNSPSAVVAPHIAMMQRWRREMPLGQVIGIRCETWASYREAPDGTWYDDPRLCPVAPIFRLGIYAVNDLISLAGAPSAVSVMQSRLFTSRPTSDNAQLSLRFAGGALATVFASFCIDDGQNHRDSMTVNFEKGTVYCNVGTVADAPKGTVRLKLVVRGDDAQATLAADVTLPRKIGGYDWESFVRAIAGETLEGAISPQQTVLGLRVMNAMQKAAETGTEQVVEGHHPEPPAEFASPTSDGSPPI